jgi:hypothetical protein
MLPCTFICKFLWWHISWAAYCLTTWGTHKLFSKVAAPVSRVLWVFWFLHILVNTWYHLPFDYRLNGYELLFHCGFNFHFSNLSLMFFNIFPCAFWLFLYLARNVFSNIFPTPFFLKNHSLILQINKHWGLLLNSKFHFVAVYFSLCQYHSILISNWSVSPLFFFCLIWRIEPRDLGMLSTCSTLGPHP